MTRDDAAKDLMPVEAAKPLELDTTAAEKVITAAAEAGVPEREVEKARIAVAAAVPHTSHSCGAAP